ncbi:hypothetical protein WJX84_002529 [Apatococcus fuscideae]|uniref:Anaphase-promoting complex subunit 4 n=1 Tax=Apatococcus fuscideae TaxID=2026836 RepID=A0AAW1TK04_9CHLO
MELALSAEAKSSTGWWQEVSAAVLPGLKGCMVSASNDSGQVAESLIVGLGILCRHQAELWHCTDLASDITLLTEQALAAVRSDAEVFAKVQRARQEQQAKLQSLSLEHGTGTPLSLHSEVAAAAAGAPLSAAMQHLLTTALGEAGLKRASKDIDAAAQQLTQSFRNSLQPHLEQLTSALASVLALTKCTPIAGQIGLQAQAFQEAASMGQQLIAEASLEHQEMLQECAEMRLYYAWLLQLTAALQDDEGRSPALSATSRKVVADTRITQGPPVARSAPGQHFLRAGQAKSSQPDLPASLQHLSEIQALCVSQFGRLASTLSAALTTAPVMQMSAGVQSWHSCTSLLPDASLLWLGSCGPQAMVLVRVRQGQGEAQVQATMLSCPESQKLVEFSYYKEETIVVVAEPLPATQQSGKLHVLPINSLPWVAQSSPVQLDHVHEACRRQGSVSSLESSASKGILVPAAVKGPLILSGPRGLACLLSAMQRASMYDLEEEDQGQADAE